MKLCTKSTRYQSIALIDSERSFSISMSLSVAFGAEARRAEGQSRSLKVDIKQAKASKVSIWHA